MSLGRRAPWRRAVARLLVAVSASSLALVVAPDVYAKKTKLTPARVKQIKTTRKSYERCRKDALAALKKGSISKKRFEVDLNACKESFPGASLYVDCKRQAIKAARSKNVAEDQSVAACKRYLVATQFDPADPSPYFVEKGQLYFAGIGMNQAFPANNLAPPNFDCLKLQQTAKAPESAQYILFGNHPRWFAGLSEKNPEQLGKALKFTKPKEEGVDVTGLGRVFGDPRKAAGAVFFPSAACDFDSDPGSVFAGLSAYYLLDGAAGTATPYFGITYFKTDQKVATTQKLVQSLVRTLGTNFRTFKKNATTTFVAAANVSETDDEQDPKNLCKQPRQHLFVGVVQGQKANPAAPEYMLLANVRNLCEFGDKLGRRFVE
jgi:hypothetical protein